MMMKIATTVTILGLRLGWYGHLMAVYNNTYKID